MTSLRHVSIQRFDNLYNHTPSATLPLHEALDAIRAGTYRRTIAQVRRVYAHGSAAAYRRAKDRLPAYTFGGTFAPQRGTKYLVQYSGIVHGDLDHLDNISAIRHVLEEDPHIVYCFASPSGAGLKVGVRITPVADDMTYKHVWAIVAAAHRDRYGIVWDPSGKDVSRLCYVSWDPDCYVNLDAEVFPIPIMTTPATQTPAPASIPPRVVVAADRRTRYAQQALARAVRMIQEAPRGQQHHTRLHAARLLGGYVAGGFLSEAEALEALQAPTEAQADNARAALKTIRDGLAYGQAAPITYAELEEERRQWIARQAPQAYYRRAQAAPTIFTHSGAQDVQAWT